ncbi:1564_t:CDS:2 [Entrophospora sp. SA101]|nr:1564_t:CDS:2 [Entrophospora sp. SA101]
MILFMRLTILVMNHCQEIIKRSDKSQLSQNESHANELENKLKSVDQRLEDPITTFSMEILKYLFEFAYPDKTPIQHGNISKSSYKLYVINMCLMKLLSGIQADLIYNPRKKESDYEQKSDGVFLMCLKNHHIEIGHVEISDDHLELWRMSNPASGVLIFERTHKVVVPIEWDNQQIYVLILLNYYGI